MIWNRCKSEKPKQKIFYNLVISNRVVREVVVLKLLMVGDSGTSKTTLRVALSDQPLPGPSLSTMLADVLVFERTLRGEQTRAILWDLSGKPFFAEIRNPFYRDVNGVLFVFDVTKRYTYDSVVDYWLEELLKNVSDSPPQILVVGTNHHLREAHNPEHVTHAEGQELANRVELAYNRILSINMQVTYHEVEPLDGTAVDFMFTHFLRAVVAHHQGIGSSARAGYIGDVEDIPENLIRLINNPTGRCFGCKRAARGILCPNCYKVIKEQFEGVPACLFSNEQFLISLRWEEEILNGDGG